MDEVLEFFDYISKKFGESSEALIKEYANSQIARNLTLIVICVAVIALCVIGLITARRMEKNEHFLCISDTISAGIYVGIVVLSIMSFIVFVISLPDLISYIVSPTGTVLREVLSKF